MREARLIQRDDARETAVVVATVMAVVLAKLYWLSRVGFENPLVPVVNSLGVSLFLIAAPLWLARAVKSEAPGDWWRSQSFIALVCVTATTVAGMIARSTGISVVLAFVVTGFALAAWTLVRWMRRETIYKSLLFIIAMGVFSVWCAGVIWGSRYKMPLFWENLAFNANIHHDTFYYASMANMLDTYGVPSTGLDGVPLIHYHYGSPWLFAQWSHLLRTDVLSFYSLGYPVIALPLFFSTLLTFSAEAGAALRRDWSAWTVFLAATVGFLPTVALDALAIWNSNAFISESHQIGLAVFFLALGTGLAFWRKEGGRGSQLGFLILFVPVMLVILGFLKISLMVLPFALVVYLTARLRLYRRPLVLLSAVLSAVGFAITYLYVAVPAQNGGLSPLDFMRFNAAAGWQQFFPLMHFFWTWFYIAGRIWEDGARDLRSLWVSLRSGRLIDAEILLIVAVCGFLPGEILSIHGGSAVYLSDVQRWLALALIMARVGGWVREWKVRRPSREAGGVRLSKVLLAFVAAPFVVTLFVNLALWPVRVARANIALRSAIGADSEAPSYLPIVTALRDIARLPRSERERSLLFIPQSNSQYWSMFTTDGRCTFTPLIAPAVASVALLDGMPPAGCQVTNQYNMTAYSPRAAPQSPADVSDLTLCAKARAKGFREVIVLDAPGRDPPRRRRLDCYLP